MLWLMPADLSRTRIGRMFIAIDTSRPPSARKINGGSTFRLEGRWVSGNLGSGNCGNPGNPSAARLSADWPVTSGNCGNPHDELHQGFVSVLRNLRNLNRRAGPGRPSAADTPTRGLRAPPGVRL